MKKILLIIIPLFALIYFGQINFAEAATFWGCKQWTEECETCGAQQPGRRTCYYTCTECGSEDTGECGNVCGPSGPPRQLCRWAGWQDCGGGTPCNITHQSPDLGSVCTNCIVDPQRGGKGGVVDRIRDFNHQDFDSCTVQQIINFWCNGGVSEEATAECQQVRDSVCSQSCGGISPPTSTPTPTLQSCLQTQGDLNGDGRVDDSDFNDWKTVFLGGSTKTICNGKTRTDLVDFNIWRYYNLTYINLL